MYRQRVIWNTAAGVYESRYVWVLRCINSLTYECVCVCVFMSVHGLPEYISPHVLLHRLTFVFLFFRKTNSVGPELSPSRDKKDEKYLTSVLTFFFFCFNLSMLTVKGLSILKVQLVVVI